MDAKTWNCRPSDLLGIEDEYVAYCFDQACGYFGRALEAELEKVEAKTEAEGKQKRQRILDRYLSMDEDEKPRPGGFADPAALVKK